MKPIAFIIGLILLGCGCAPSMRVSAQRWDVMRPDGTAQVGAMIATDTSLPREARESVALCVLPAGADPIDSLEDLAGACASGCELLMVDRTVSDESRIEDHLLVLRRYLDERRTTPPRAVLVIGIRGGDAVATTIANREARVTHLALLAPAQSVPAVPQPVFIAQLGGVTDSPRPNVTVRHYPVADERWRERGTGRTIRPLIELDLITWLTDTGALTNERAVKLSKRVKAAHREWYGPDRHD